jgi:hypothetical protein
MHAALVERLRDQLGSPFTDAPLSAAFRAAVLTGSFRLESDLKSALMLSSLDRLAQLR